MKTPCFTLAVAAAALAAAASALVASPALAGPPAPGTVHVRGTVQRLKNGVLVVAGAGGPVTVQLPAKTPVVSVIPSDRAHVKEGSFLGIASVPGPGGGAQQAREVVVFPEAARGTGEGSYDWDLPGGAGAGGSKMTNGTAAGHSRMTNGTARMTNGTASRSRMTNGTVRGAGTGGTSELTLEFKNKSGGGKGTQKITLPAGIPFVTFTAGQMSQLVPGAHVVVFGHRGTGGAGAVTADRVLVGKDGLVPPM